MTDAGPEVFDEHLDAWRAWQATPWGRIRYGVGIAAESAAAQGLTPRVVTLQAGLDAIADLELGAFDLVLCHNVVQYRADLDATVEAIARSVGSGGALSLLAPNPAADVMAAAVARDEPSTALDLLDAPSQLTETFGHEVRRIPVEAAAASLDAVGLTVWKTYGIQCVTHLVPNRRKEEPAFFAELEALELALCAREPYLRVARFWQVVARRP